jgi:Na+/H+-dicarboxylate symporter
MTSSTRILIGLVAGIAVGLFVGEQIVAIKWAADGFVKLLQMTVLPYVTVSIASSLGRMNYASARALGLRGGAVLLLVWAIALALAFLIPLTFPPMESATFFSTTLVERRAPFNFIELYIPSNPFNSLANNVVPAVVLFSVLVGIALIHLERKQALLDVLQAAGDALAQATRFVTKLTPYGLFAIAAVAAGTLSVEQLGRLQVYLVSYVAMALLVSLWVLPGLVGALTGIPVRDLFASTRDALITAFVAGDLFIVLPQLIEASKALIARHVTQAREAADLPDTIVPASFNFPHTGKLLSISFVLFAGWFSDAAVRPADYPRLALMGPITFFGSLNVAVPFLLDLFRIPADTFQLFLASGVINSRFGTLVAAVHTLTIALLGTCAMSGALRWRHAAVLRYALVSLALTATVIGGTRVLFATVIAQTYTNDKIITGMRLLGKPVGAVVLRSRPDRPAEPPAAAQLDAIRARGTLRVGYMADALPFSFFNDDGDLVGLDVELANALSSELGLRLEFVPVTRDDLEDTLARGECDLVMSGVAVTTERASRLLFSSAYLDETLAFVVPDEARDQFADWSTIRAKGPMALAAPDVPYYVAKLRELVPQAQVRVFTSIPALFAHGGQPIDAILLPAERGSAWTLMYPKFTVVVPGPPFVKIPLAFPVARRDQALASFLNTWIELKRRDGTIDALYQHWVLGRDAARPTPRWSVVRNVLHWVD